MSTGFVRILPNLVRTGTFLCISPTRNFMKMIALILEIFVCKGGGSLQQTKIPELMQLFS